MDDEISKAILDFGGSGKNVIGDTVIAQLPLEDAVTPLASLPLSNTVISLLVSSLDAQQLADVCAYVVQQLEEEDKEQRLTVLTEALVDAVEVVNEEKEDVGAPEEPKTEEMDVDGETSTRTMPPGEKGVELIKLLMESSTIPTIIPNLLLSPEILLKLGLHPFPSAPTALQRSHVKRSTTLFYKQSKYNLLRESSEGFSALIVLLTSTDSLSPTYRSETSKGRSLRAKRVWDKIMALIGYFNLSPPRVLDIILDIASCQVAAHWRFFLDLLRCSPWGSTALPDGKGKQKAVDSWLDDEVDEIKDALAKGGDRVLSQVLGVKFGFFQKPDGGETPHGLVYLAALLVKYSFVSLADLLPFLSPDDAQLEVVNSNYLKTVTQGTKTRNKLTETVLVDDEAAPETPSTNTEDAGPPKPPPEQRIILLQASLAIGDLSTALYFLGKYPSFAQSHPSISDLILRIVKYALEPVYSPIAAQGLGDYTEDELGLADVRPNAILKKIRPIVPTLIAPCPPDTVEKQFEFFYPEWHHGLERWSSIQDIHDKGMRWLGLVRGLGGRDVETMVKICRIGAAHFVQLQRAKSESLDGASTMDDKERSRLLEPTTAEMKPWLNIIRFSLLPALSASGATAAFDVELWHLLKHLPYMTRYNLYAEWRDATCAPGKPMSCPVAVPAAEASTKGVRDALRRVVAPGGGGVVDRGPARSLAKLSHTNPQALWSTAVHQVRNYSNIGQFIVEAGRYMTQLSTDVAAFTLLDGLANPPKGTRMTNENGTDVALWLSSLATFVGDFSRRYVSMDLQPVLQFIVNRLMDNQIGDLTILDRLISIMSGVSQVENDAISTDQVQAYAGGRELVKEAFYSTTLTINRPVEGAEFGAKAKEAPFDRAKSTKKSLPRLVAALRDTALAVPIWIALAKVRQESMENLEEEPIKVMSMMQDTVHGTFIQYGELLAEHLSSDEHISATPNLGSLVSEFDLDFVMAFQILRPRLNAELQKAKSAKEAAMRLKIAAAKEAGTIASPIRDTTPLPSPTLSTKDLPEDGDVAMKEEQNGDQDHSTIPAPKATSDAKVWYPASLRPTMEQARELLPADVNSCMGAPFFVIFWHLTMSDIAFSPEAYDKAISKIEALDRDVASWRAPLTSEQRAERTRLKARIDQLKEEKEAQSTTVATTSRRLQRESKHWFGSFVVEKNMQRKLSYQLHQYCFIPRCLQTPADAIFVAKFIRLAHDLGTVGFSTVFVYQNFFSDNLAGTIFSCTTNEARNFGRCLSAMMQNLDAWHSSEALYKKEALGLKDGDDSGKKLPGMIFKSRRESPMSAMSWTQFRDFYGKAHNALTKALVSCWGETDFMHIKNAISVGLQVVEFFPVMESNAREMTAAVKDLVDGKKGHLTPDLQHQCQAYLQKLTKRHSTRPYVAPHLFHPSGPKPAPREPPQVAKPVVQPTNGEASKPASRAITPPLPPPALEPRDPKVLRARLEERSRAAAAQEALKAEQKATPASPAVADVEAKAKTPPLPVDGDKTSPTGPPAGPRATRSTASVLPVAPTGPTGSTRNGASESRNAPTGPSAASPAPRNTSMGPPPTASPATSTAVDEERAAARARKFGPGARPPPSAPSSTAENDSKSASVKIESDVVPDRVRSPATSRRSSPSRRRSRSAESRASERSRRSHRGRDDRDRDTRSERSSKSDAPVVERVKELLGDAASERARSPAGPPSVDADRKRQEDLLQARADKLASAERETRRSSRDGSRRDDKDREEKKSRDRERDRSARPDDDSISQKRKRDEEVPRRIDDPKDRDRAREDRHRGDRHESRREERKDRRDEKPDHRREDRDRRRERDRDPRESRDGRDLRDPRDGRDARDPRDGGRDVRRDHRDPRDRGSVRDAARPRSPDPRERNLGGRELVAEDNRPDRTPRRDGPKDVNGRTDARPISQPSGPNDRIIEPPRVRPSEPPVGPSRAPPSSGTTYALPRRPEAPRSGRPPTPPHQSGLAARMGAAPSGPSSDRSRLDGPPRPLDMRGPPSGPSDLRKRPHEVDLGGPAREESPGASKRVKIDRDKARGHDRRGREAAGSRMLASAMKGANE